MTQFVKNMFYSLSIEKSIKYLCFINDVSMKTNQGINLNSLRKQNKSKISLHKVLFQVLERYNQFFRYPILYAQ